MTRIETRLPGVRRFGVLAILVSLSACASASPAPDPLSLGPAVDPGGAAPLSRDSGPRQVRPHFGGAPGPGAGGLPDGAPSPGGSLSLGAGGG